MYENSVLKFKVIFIGDSYVGKSSIIYKYIYGDEHGVTLGATTNRLSDFCENQKILINIWDTSEHDTYDRITPIFAEGSNAVIFVFDQAKKISFEHINEWEKYSEKCTNNEDVIKILVANKSDLAIDIDLAEVQHYASDHNMFFIRTSIKDLNIINELFSNLKRMLWEKFKNRVIPDENNEEVAKNSKENTSKKKEKHSKKGKIKSKECFIF